METLFSFLLQLLSLQFEGPIGLEFYIYIYIYIYINEHK